MAIKVHGSAISTATQRVLACLHEKCLPYEFVPVDMGAGDHKKAAFLSINPFGQVPALEDGDLKLFESRAISQYIAHAYPEKGTSLIFSDIKSMAIIGVGMQVESQQFDGPASKLAFEHVYKPMFGKVKDDAVVKEHEVKLAKVLDLYEIRLTECKYLSGDTFTLTDLHHLPLVDCLMGTESKKIIEDRPHVCAWAKDILARQAWKDVVAMKTKH